LDATHGSYCYQHAPETLEERRRNASRGGKTGGNGRPGSGEVAEIKKEIRGVIGGVLSGRVERSTGATMFMGFNVLLRAVEIARKIKEQDEVLARLEALEEQQPDNTGGGYRNWHR
jgi:hypothetical protein